MPSTIRGSDNFDSGVTPLSRGTAVITTSGTSVEFTGIPAGVKRLIVAFNKVKTNGTDAWRLQLGSGSYTTTGYTSSVTWHNQNGSITNGLLVTNIVNPSYSHSGICTLVNTNVNNWVMAGSVARSDGYTVSGAGSVTIGGSLDRIRLLTANGTNVFNLGEINIFYEL